MGPRHFSIADFARRNLRQLALILTALILGLLAACLIIPAELRDVTQQLIGFPDSDVVAQKARPCVLFAICMIPALGAMLYTSGGIIDRYISRRFLSMFTLCIVALYVIWWLIDMTDHISEFRQSDGVIRTIAIYYGTRLPAAILLLLPYALLLSLLESLGKLSTNREIIGMIQSGRSVLRITMPLILAGLLCTMFTMGVNYHWAPIADGNQDEILAQATGRNATEASKVLYRNRLTERLWMVSAFPPDYEKGQPLIGVEVTITDAKGQLDSRLSASRASWDKTTHKWTFKDALLCRYAPGQPPVFEHFKDDLVIDSWTETPWQIIKPGLSAEYLGIPDLNAWLYTNAQFPQMADEAPYLTHWHYRWALPFACLITVLLATPLSIHFSRHGAGGGIFVSVTLSALMMLVNTIILSFGESGHLPPMLAAWLPNIIFGIIGIYLYQRRISGRSANLGIRKWLAAT